MESNNIYGVVVDNVLYSNRMELKLRQPKPNGIYSIDMSADDFQESISSANIDDARKFFQKASKVKVIRGVAFHDGIIPENPVSFPKVPLKVTDATYDDFEEIEVAIVRDKICYYIQTLTTEKSYILLDLKQIFESKVPTAINKIKGITPEIRLAYTFHLIERKRKEVEEPVKALKRIMEESGAKVELIKKHNRGYEVRWSSNNYNIITQLDNKFKVVHAGFCTSSYDHTQSAGSVVHLLRDYADRRVSSGDYVNITRR